MDGLDKPQGETTVRIFVTGATSFIDSAFLPELGGVGHTVPGLTRSAESAAALLASGAEIHIGDVQEPDTLRKGVTHSAGVIHLAFNHDFSGFQSLVRTTGNRWKSSGSFWQDLHVRSLSPRRCRRNEN
nr:NAD-dependent epimerase/dehydratase family protein [Acidipila sp. EB88]